MGKQCQSRSRECIYTPSRRGGPRARKKPRMTRDANAAHAAAHAADDELELEGLEPRQIPDDVFAMLAQEPTTAQRQRELFALCCLPHANANVHAHAAATTTTTAATTRTATELLCMSSMCSCCSCSSPSNHYHHSSDHYHYDDHHHLLNDHYHHSSTWLTSPPSPAAAISLPNYIDPGAGLKHLEDYVPDSDFIFDSLFMNSNGGPVGDNGFASETVSGTGTPSHAPVPMVRTYKSDAAMYCYLSITSPFPF